VYDRSETHRSVKHSNFKSPSYWWKKYLARVEDREKMFQSKRVGKWSTKRIRLKIMQNIPNSIRYYFFKLSPPRFRNTPDQKAISSSIKPGRDYYTVGFCIDLICMIFLFVAYPNIGSSKVNSNSNVLEGGRFDGQAVTWIFFNITFIVGDRACYLHKSLFWKFVHQVVSIMVYTIVCVVIWPSKRKLGMMKNSYSCVFYGMKCVYWYVSAIQIKFGYESVSKHHDAITKRAGYYIGWVFKIYMLIPYLFELRVLMDWAFKPTALDFYDLLKVEDIYTKLYMRKCDIITYVEWRKRAEPMPTWYKVCQGCCLISLILMLLFFPMLLFSDVNPASSRNYVNYATVEVVLEVDHTTTSATESTTLFEIEYLSIDSVDSSAYSLYYDSESQIMQSITFKETTNTDWLISPPARNNLVKTLSITNETSDVLVLNVLYKITRDGPPASVDVEFTAKALTLNVTTAKTLADIVSFGDDPNLAITTDSIPTYLWSSMAEQHPLRDDDESKQEFHSPVVIKLDFNHSAHRDEWWVLKMKPENVTSTSTLPNNSTQFRIFVISDDYVNGSVLSLIGVNNYSFSALFFVVFITFGRMIRSALGGAATSIQITELQNVDKLFQICTAISEARNQGNFKLEEELFRKLIRIYRDPKLMIQLTKRKDKKKSE